MQAHRLTKTERIALISAISGAIFNVFLYGIGANLQDATNGSILYYVRIVAGITQALAFDAVAVATVAGQRYGRRSKWGQGVAIASALVSALIALDVAGVWHQPWLHAANSLIVLAFMFHLQAPIITSRIGQLRALARRLIKLLRDERQVVADLRQEVASRDTIVADLRHQLADNAATMADLRQEVADARNELARRPQPAAEEVVYVASFALTWQQMVQLAATIRQLDTVSLTTLRRKVADVGKPIALLAESEA